jgi:hypothetical protein
MGVALRLERSVDVVGVDAVGSECLPVHLGDVVVRAYLRGVPSRSRPANTTRPNFRPT